jgi:hypothetical protein
MFTGVPYLKMLELSHNEISVVEDHTFADLEGLVEINMRFNNINNITHNTFNGLPSLQQLDISNNNIYYIHSNSFTSLHRLKYLEVFGTRMPCTCTYIRMLRSLNLYWTQADCLRHISTSTRPSNDNTPGMPVAVPHDGGQARWGMWEVWSDCDDGACADHSRMRSALCIGCDVTSSPLCVRHMTGKETGEECVFFAFSPSVLNSDETSTCKSSGCNATAQCRRRSAGTGIHWTMYGLSKCVCFVLLVYLPVQICLHI